MGRSRVPLLAAFLSLGLLLAAGIVAQHHSGPAGAAQTPAYLALGDSIAYGVGASDPAQGGYVGLVYGRLRESDRYRESGLDLMNLSVPGAVSADLLLPGGQLEAALDEIEARDGGVEIITIDIGGNDLLTLARRDSPCLSETDTEDCRREVRDVLGGLQANLAEVLAGLREAAPDAAIVVMDLYNPYSGTGDPRESIAELGVGQLNGVIGAAAADADLRVKLASVFQLFRGRGLAWIAPDGIHPNDNGHAVIAEVVLSTIEGRSPVIPDDLLGSPGVTVSPGAGSDGDGSGDDTLMVLVIAVPASFAAGALVSGAYFAARGRRG